MDDRNETTDSMPNRTPKRRLVAAAVVGGLALVGGGWAISHSGLVGSDQPAATAQQLDLRQNAGPQPANKPTAATKDASVDPMQAQFQAIAQASLTDLGTKLNKSPDEIATAMEAVGPRIKPTQNEMASYKTGDTTTQQQLRAAIGNRWLTAMSAELSVDRATLATAVNEVKTEQVKANEPLIKAALSRAVAQGELTRAEADALFTALKDEKIGS